jgi:hypothetical protein
MKCEIHNKIFRHDEDCPTCEEDRSNDIAIPYIDHIEYLESKINSTMNERKNRLIDAEKVVDSVLSNGEDCLEFIVLAKKYNEKYNRD